MAKRKKTPAPPREQAGPEFPAEQLARPGVATESKGSDKDQEILRLTQELERPRASLQGAREDREAEGEELRVTNEELRNTEEELQAVNEELLRANQELQEQISLGHQLNDDLTNLIDSAKLASVVLDRELRIRRFTPAARQVLRLLPTDVGQPIGEFQQTLHLTDLERMADQVLHTREVQRREVLDRKGRWYELALRPYQTRDQTIEGVVLTLVDIDDRKRAEENARRLAALVEVSDDAIIGQAADGTITSWNTGAERLYGYTAAEAVGQSILLLVPPDDSDELRQVHDRLRRGEQVPPFETRRVHKDGRVLFVSVRLSPIRDTAGRLIGIAAVTRDLSERKRAEEALRREHDFSERLIETARAIILVLDRTGRIVRFNRYLEELTGYRLEEVRGKNWFDTFLPERDRRPIRELFGRAIRGTRTRGNVNAIFTRDGRERQIEWFDTELTDAEGQLIGLLCVGQDVTDRLRMEAGLRESEERYRALVETSPDSITLTDLEGNILLCNRQGLTLSGAERLEEVVGRSVFEFIAPEDHQRARDNLLKTLTNGSIHGIEYTLVRRDTTRCPVELNAALLRDDTGEPRAFIGVVRDLSSRKQLEREVLEIATLEQRRIGQELHDSTGQELTALALLAESLAELLQERSPTETALAAKVVRGLKRTLGQVRAFSRGLMPVEVDAQGLAAALAELAARTSELHRVNCTFRCKMPVRVEDNQTATHLYRIAQEAVSNALKHGRPRSIRISLEGGNQPVTLRIQDDGVGFREPPAEGPGMGLKIMHYRAGLIHARLTIEPAKPAGTLVNCTLSGGSRYAQEKDQRPKDPGAHRR